jgi:hypothetical protein
MSVLKSLMRLKGLSLVHSSTEECGVQGWKTFVDNADKLKEASMPYVWLVMIVPLQLSVLRARPQTRHGHLCRTVGQHVSSVLVVILYLKDRVLHVRHVIDLPRSTPVSNWQTKG